MKLINCRSPWGRAQSIEYEVRQSSEYERAQSMRWGREYVRPHSLEYEVRQSSEYERPQSMRWCREHARPPSIEYEVKHSSEYERPVWDEAELTRDLTVWAQSTRDLTGLYEMRQCSEYKSPDSISSEYKRPDSIIRLQNPCLLINVLKRAREQFCFVHCVSS